MVRDMAFIFHMHVPSNKAFYWYLKFGLLVFHIEFCATHIDVFLQRARYGKHSSTLSPRKKLMFRHLQLFIPPVYRNDIFFEHSSAYDKHRLQKRSNHLKFHKIQLFLCLDKFFTVATSR
jgi:hypothetical protein